MKRHLVRTFLGLVLFASIVGAHELLRYWMVEGNTVASLLAAGPHLAIGDVLLAISFLTLRVLTVLLLPGLVLRWIWLRVTDRSLERVRDKKGGRGNDATVQAVDA